MIRDLLARTLHDLSTYPTLPNRHFDDLEDWEKDRWERQADELTAVLQAHNYSFLKFLSDQGGKL